ncbi:RNA polymerase sigma factor SigW [bacterium]|nr:RNA polymerase sigma factor SigW [bacterium]
MTPSDEQLVQESLKDKNKFALLVERYEQRLLRYIKRLTGRDNNQSEDILQEVFIKIYRNLNDFDTNLKFSSWAYRITHNEAINHARKIKETIPLETDDKETANLINILKSDTNIPEEISQKELAEKVQKIIEKLPKKYRDVIILYYLEDKDYQEISDILKKPTSTIGTLLSRAKAKFKQLSHKHDLV